MSFASSLAATNFFEMHACRIKLQLFSLHAAVFFLQQTAAFFPQICLGFWVFVYTKPATMFSLKQSLIDRFFFFFFFPSCSDFCLLSLFNPQKLPLFFLTRGCRIVCIYIIFSLKLLQFWLEKQHPPKLPQLLSISTFISSLKFQLRVNFSPSKINARPNWFCFKRESNLRPN